MLPRTTAVILLLFFLTGPASAQTATSPLRLVINGDQGTTTISRHLFGHFAEHLGRDIYGGFWVKGSDGKWQLNEPVVDALRRLNPPNVRWPGGCFADIYHWQDGIGPYESRPTVVNTIWGGVTEDNSFGSHEFMQLVQELEAEPIIVGNVGSGTVEEMADWWEYMNHPGKSPMADLRAVNGHPAPWNVQYWGVGNESWGCGGNMSADYYADQYKRFATFLHRYGDVHPFRIATGPAGDDYQWMETLMQEAGHMIDGIDLHHYTVVGTWADKGSATDFNEADWITAMRKALYFEELLTRHTAIMDQYDPEQRVWLIVGEWGMWHNVEPGTNPGFLYQQNTLRDALTASLSLDIFSQHADRVKMANIAQTINVLQSMILTNEHNEIILTPTYHVFEMYKVHHDATLLPISLEAGSYTYENETIQALSATASLHQSGVIHTSLTNIDPNHSRTITIDLRGASATQVNGRILTALTINAHNTFDQPNTVQSMPFDGAHFSKGTLTVEIPPKSIVVLALIP